MSDTLFFDTMLPMVEKKGCVLLMNSTLVDRYNFYTRILDKLEEEQQQPKPCGHVFRLTLICQRCLDRERMIGISATHCKHMLHLIPPWKEASKLETVRRLMDSDREKIFRRESLGVLAGSSKTLFDHNDIKYFNEMPYFQRRIDVKPDPLYLIVDPNAGGPSHMAIILMTRFCDKMVICGLYSKSTRTANESKDLFDDFIHTIGRDPWLKDANIRLVVERDTGHEEGWLRQLVKHMPHITAMRENDSPTFGLHTDNPKKMMYAERIHTELKRHTLVFLENFIVLQPLDILECSDIDRIRSDQKRDLIEQLRRAQLIKNVPNNPSSRGSISWWGKCDANGKRNPEMQDDKAMALGMALYSESVSRFVQWTK